VVDCQDWDAKYYMRLVDKNGGGLNGGSDCIMLMEGGSGTVVVVLVFPFLCFRGRASGPSCCLISSFWNVYCGPQPK